MPHVEPFVIRAVRRVSAEIADGQLALELQRFVREEAAHHAQHRRFNALVIQRYPRLRGLDALLGFSVRWLDRRSAHVGTGFAAGFELMGLAVALWLAPRVDLLFGDADPVAASLFLWHLGEEVEHRSIAHDVHQASGGGKLSAAFGLLIAVFMLGAMSVVGALIMMARDRRWLRPVAWWRLVMWAIGFLWVSGPLLVSSLWTHPSSFLAPVEAGEWRSQRPISPVRAA